MDKDTILFIIAIFSALFGTGMFFFKTATKVNTTDINLGHEVEENKAMISGLERRLAKVEDITAAKITTDALLSQKFDHMSTTIDELKGRQMDVMSQMMDVIKEFQRLSERRTNL
jgi:hypothetical protein